MKDKLDILYSDIKSVPNYSAKITEFLRKNDLHSQYRRIVKKKFPRRRVMARFPFEIFMADLIEYPNDRFVNNGYKFILILIDCFTKMVYAAPMKKKNKEWTADAFESIFKHFDQFPTNLVTDGGKEFFNSSVQKVFHNYGINHYRASTKTKFKASVAERVIGTLKRKLEKYFVKNETRKWTDILDKFVLNYNKTPHRSIGMAPLDVTNDNREQVYKQLYPDKNISVVCKYKVGDKVRKLRAKKDFEKGYTPNWSEKIYQIADSRQSHGVCYYKIGELDGKILNESYYYYELNLVAKHDN